MNCLFSTSSVSISFCRVLVPGETPIFVKSISDVMYVAAAFWKRRAALLTHKIAGTGCRLWLVLQS